MAQRGRGSPLPVVGGRKEAKNANVHVVVFCLAGRRPAAPSAKPPQRGVLRPPGFSSSMIPAVIRPTVGKSETLSRCSPIAPRLPAFLPGLLRRPGIMINGENIYRLFLKALCLPALTAVPPWGRTGGLSEELKHSPREDLRKPYPSFRQAGINLIKIISKPLCKSRDMFYVKLNIGTYGPCIGASSPSDDRRAFSRMDITGKVPAEDPPRF